jgi:vancomycin resistance protein YoaR
VIVNLPRPSRKVLVAAAIVLAVLLPGIGLTAAYAYAGDVPRGTSVLGVDIGAMGHDEAAAALRAGLDAHAETLAAPVEVRVGESAAQLDPAEVGLAVDVEASVDRAVRSGAPIPALFGGREVAPVVTVDAEALDEQLQEIVEENEAGEAMTMPAVTFEGTEPVPVYPEPGLGIDPQRSAEAVTGGWPRLAGGGGGQWREPAAISIPLVEINPVTTAADVDRLIAEFAAPAVAAPVTITTPEGRSFEAPPAAIAASLRLKADSRGEIIPKVSKKALRRALADQLAEVEAEPVDARITLDGGEPSVVDSVNGEEVDTGALAGELLAVLTEPAPRAVEAETTVVEAEFKTEDAAGLGVAEQVSTFTTSFEGGLTVPRNHNIALVSEMVDGAIVKPGETFSLNGHTGERGYDKGFQDAPVILGGRLQPAVGGGISQFTTTLFNASYYAGLEDVEHHPHSYHYTRYPAVIESTIFYPDLDMQFRNNTDYGVLIDTSVNDTSITVSMWSTKVWDEVTTEWSAKRDITKPKRQYVDPGPTCIATVGIDGFTQDAWRIFHNDGKEVTREKFSWRYDAQPEVICGEEPDEDDD